MKIIFKSVIPFLLLPLFLASCTKEKGMNNSNATASLTIALKDENGNLITENCYVWLYRNVDDWSKDEHRYQEPKFPGAEGKVFFYQLEPQKYYWRISTIEKDNCSRNNLNDNYTDMGLTTPLNAGEQRQITAVVTPKGNYVITNSTANSYRLFINGTEKAITGYGTYSDPYAKAGNYVIRIVQQTTGGTPIDSTFNIQVSCGQLTQVTI